VTWYGWTEADDAELEVLVHELVDLYYEHLDRCSFCPERARACPATSEAAQAVLDWLCRRRLHSAAARLRAEQDFLEWKRDSGSRPRSKAS
jgi:hypothetical protein